MRTVKISVLMLACLFPNLNALTTQEQFRYYVSTVKQNNHVLPLEKTIPFDWKATAILENIENGLFAFNERITAKNKKIWFRITSATDVREEIVVEIKSAKSGTVIGEFDIRYAHYMQPFQLEIPRERLNLILREGVVMTLKKGSSPFWIFVPDAKNNQLPTAFLPHLLVSDARKSINSMEWKNALNSFTSLSTFGWMEGCVLDGLHTLANKDSASKTTIMNHLSMYFDNDTLTYEAYNNSRSGKINTVESVLPFAFLSIYNPQHSMIQHAIDYCLQHADSLGIIADGTATNRMLKTEECFTISYPLAILARDYERDDLQELAIINLEERVKLLSTQGAIYQRAMQIGNKDFANWARGIGWYLLGMSKTLTMLPNNERTDKLKAHLRKDAAFVMQHQQANGLWHCFIDEPATGIETSGSAIIAAALAHAYQQGFIGFPAKAAAEKCYDGLQAYSTPDGFLTGTVQVNKGGESLQRNGYRVISPYTLGFLGVLVEISSFNSTILPSNSSKGFEER
ncbi:MAG: glycoside hydrolase family 88 protein [Paludibacter sp.]|nr:glycoside hydrolase family 88 protein [Paludibacter sp.]